MAEHDDQPPESNPWSTRRALEILGFAFVLPVATAVGFLVGQWIGERVGAPQAGSIMGALLGALGGFWELYRVIVRSG